MARKNTKPVRIVPELADIMREMADKNDLSMPEVSKEIAKIVKEMRFKKIKFNREIKF